MMSNKITELLQKPIWQMTGEEFLELNSAAQTSHTTTSLVYGVGELSKYLGCCPATVYTLKKQGVLDGAIVSRVGKKIVFDANKALDLVQAYKQ